MWYALTIRANTGPVTLEPRQGGELGEGGMRVAPGRGREQKRNASVKDRSVILAVQLVQG